MRTPTNSYKRHRFHSQFISHVVWLYARFSLSLREVEELLLEPGVDVSYESIRRWTVRFGVKIARKLRRRQSRPGDGWYLNEVAVKIAGRKFWLWRAVDQHGVVLQEILQPKQDKQAAKRLLTSLIRRHGFVSKRIVTDKLRSYGATKLEVAPGLDHWPLKGLNNCAENSHLPFQTRARSMQGARAPGGLQRCVSIHSATRNRFAVPSCRRAALTVRYHRMEALDAWKAAASIA